MSEPGLIERLDRVEAALRTLRAEVDEVRRLAAAGVTATAETPAPVAATSAVEESPVVVTSSPAETIARAWSEFERGHDAKAVDLAWAALRQALAAGDEPARLQVAAFATAAEAHVVGVPLRQRVVELGARARGFDRPPEPAAVPAIAPVRPAWRPPAPAASERFAAFAASELSGARAFAVAGGVVTLLGVVFLFVLAANRGWIGPLARVSIGALASFAVLGAGVALRVRFGRTQASLAAVGTGIAGGYATLAAATIIYGFLPNEVALLVAAAIAATGSYLALRWQSEILAGLSLVGAAGAPGLVALDDGIGAAGTAFAIVVFAASFVAAARRRWLWLAVAVGVVAIGQVAWLTGASAANDPGAIAVAVGAAIVLLAGSIAWQLRSAVDGVDPAAAAFALSSGGLALVTLLVLLPFDRDAAFALAGEAALYGLVAYAIGRRRPDLGWVAGAVALVFAGIATSLWLSQRSLTIAWAVEAIALAGLAWRLRTPRFQLASLVYLALGITHLLVLDLWVDRPDGDLPASAAAGMYAVAAAAVVAGTLALDCRRDRRSIGILARFEQWWDRLVAARGSLRFLLYGVSVLATAGGTAALTSGRSLTLALLGAAAALGIGAFVFGETRLQAAALAFVTFATVHAWAVDAQPDTLALARGADPLAPVPSLAALAAVFAILGRLSAFSERGIRFIGPRAGAERALDSIASNARVLRGGLLTGSVWLAAWAAGLLLVRASYDPGQAGATALWAAVGAAGAAVAARRRSPPVAVAALAPTLFSFGKATVYDWHELAAGSASASVILAATGLLSFGFFVRYAAAAARWRVEVVSFACAVTATVAALTAVDRLAPGRMQVLGAAALVVAAVVGALAVPPFVAWRHGAGVPWLRDLATVYWAVALVTVAFAERDLVSGDKAQTVALWAASAACVGTAAAPARELRLWLAAVAASLVAAVTCLALVTVVSRLVISSGHPGDGLWALAVCILSLGWLARIGPDALERVRATSMLAAVAATVFAFSLGVLEIAERVSGASVATDFQRGHTVVSALWGTLALGLFVAGIVRADLLLRRLGLALFGLALAKLFLYDLRNLSSVTRALSFLAVGTILLAAAFFAERIIHGGGRGGHPGARTA